MRLIKFITFPSFKRLHLPAGSLLMAMLIAGLLTVTMHSAHAAMESYPVVKLRSLDKITARSLTFEAKVGSTVKFGPLYIKVQACKKAEPIDMPESASFLQIWEINDKDKSEWIFSGWMFSSSPALSPMDHAVYDVWVLDCLEHKTGEEPTETKEETSEDSAEISKKAEETAPEDTE